MSNSKLKTSLSIFTLVCVGIVSGVGGMKYYESKNPPVLRSIASVEAYKPSRLMLGKQAAAMSVEIVGPAEGAETANEITELAGFITQNIEGDTWLDYKWTLPRGVELVQGQIAGSLQSATLGQSQRVTILVKGFSKQRQKLISLSAEIGKAGTQLSGSAVIVSRPDDTMENRVMKIRKNRLALGKSREAK